MKGDPTLCKSQASWKETVKGLNNEGEGYMLASHSPIGNVPNKDNLIDDLAAILA